MHTPFSVNATRAFLACTTLALTACNTDDSDIAENSTPLTIEVKKGEVLQLIAPQARTDGNSARQAYYDKVFPIAESLGYERLGQLNVKQKVISDYNPGAFIFYSWPDEEAEDGLYSRPDWPALKAVRPEAWTELKIYSDTLDQDLTLNFDPAKQYTVVVAWFDPAHPGDYERYLSGIENAVTREGGRFIYKMRRPRFEAHASSLDAPGQITFVEWDSNDGFARVQKSDEYKANAKFFNSGLESFEFYWLAPSID
ncbi:MAG: hypothetical protein AAF936_01725 [Pseudomonadota bacterium]